VLNTAKRGINSFEILYPITHKIKFLVSKFYFMTIIIKFQRNLLLFEILKTISKIKIILVIIQIFIIKSNMVTQSYSCISKFSRKIYRLFNKVPNIN
jgi:hypothetical protein